MTQPWRLLFALALVALVGALWAPAPGGAASRVQTARFAIHGPTGERESAVAMWPTERQKERLPIVIAFHGMAESKAGPDKGYRAWSDDYALPRAFEALLGGKVTGDTFGGLVRDGEVGRVNAELAAQAYRGVFVVGVYTPNLLADLEQNHVDRIDAFARWVALKLVPKVRDTFPVTESAERRVGVDGVSLGGMVALEVGVRYPEVFGAVGTMQPAIRGREAQVAQRLAEAGGKAPQKIRLLSSDKDPLLPVTRTLSEELRKRRVAHTLVVTPGGHDYAFNRGPGAVELLRFHERALREPLTPAPSSP